MIGVCADKGSRPYQEDVYFLSSLPIKTAKSSRHLYFYGIFDGHNGSRAAHFVSKEIFNCLMRLCEERVFSDEFEQFDEEFRFVLRDAFAAADESWMNIATPNHFQDGSTATVSVVDVHNPLQPLLFTAQVGDSRAVLCRKGYSISLTPEHNFYSSFEVERVANKGGRVLVGSDDRPRLEGMLIVSRSFGDLKLRHLGIEPLATISSTPLLPLKDTALILGSDGLFDLISSQEACDVIKNHKNVQVAAERLVELALEYGSADNCTCMVVPLHSWGKYTEVDYTKLLRRFKLTHLFGNDITRGISIPKPLRHCLAEADGGRKQKRDLVYEIFKIFDTDQDGKIHIDELAQGLQTLGHQPDTEHLQEMIETYGDAKGQYLTIEQFWEHYGDEIDDI
eukprot:CAMPEP_0201559242 /NCGR_PEP_ID=MMETSP0173_2-20130828/72687_1 /ASSEMBLY_ACC=CAM_ASM_000268 /TAXON_ID=218659 /ORGANISM="Vexillifera sp., Strain DIVA3 564/2" /LENGTH=393 /DNA_ID=CAMNT_0047973113 /DNA_START=432 /DNA_END=1613 /DNA_ORIENTATION=+